MLELIFQQNIKRSEDDQKEKSLIGDLTPQVILLFAICFLLLGIVHGASADYYVQGTMKSENLLSGAEVTDITGFDVTADIPVGTSVGVSFSQNRVDFYSSGGTEGGWDSCSDGTTSVDISGLGWSGGSLFYKLKLETTDPTATPTVEQVELTYDGEEVPAPGNPHYAVGIMKSTDLLDGSGGEMTGVEYFGYGIASLPYGTQVLAQFSTDGTNFYDSAGTIWAWDTLSAGEHTGPETALDLSGLAWRGQTSFYYKLKFTTTVDNKTTPVVKKAGLLAFTAETGGTSVGSVLPESVAYWKFDEGVGDTAFDSVGDNDGTLEPGTGGTNTTESAMWSLDGKYGKAMEFDGVDDYINVGNPSALDIEEQISVSTWVYSNADNNNRLVSKHGGTDNYGWMLARLGSSNSFEWYISTTGSNWNGGETSANSFPVGEWINVIATYDGSYMRVYVNGKEDTGGSFPAALTGSMNVSTDPTRLGWQYIFYLNGLLDETKIYNTALTAEQVKTEYNSGKSLVMGSSGTDSSTGEPTRAASGEYCVPGDTSACDAPVLELKMDEKTGSTVYDSSGNGNDGTISGASWGRGKYGSAVVFDVDDEQVSVSDSSTIQNLSTFTYSAWVKADYDTDSQHPVMEKGSGSSQRKSFYLGSSDGSSSYSRVYAFVDTDSTNVSSVSVSDTYEVGEWEHWTFTYDDSGDRLARIYKNGKEVQYNSQTAGTGTMVSDAGMDFALGSTPGTQFFDFKGSIDDVKIYDYVRTPAQIAWDYNKGKPLGWWKMDEADGTQVDDWSGNGQHGIMTNMDPGTDRVSGKFGGGLDFDGDEDYVDIGNDSAFDLDTSMTISAWINPASSVMQYQALVSRGAGSNVGYELYYNGVAEYVRLWNGSGANSSSGSVVPNTGWHHIAVAVSGGYANFYVDGEFNNSGVFNPGASGSNNLYVGSFDGSSEFFEGGVDDVRVYNYPLTATQIKEMYNGGAVNFK